MVIAYEFLFIITIPFSERMRRKPGVQTEAPTERYFRPKAVLNVCHRLVRNPSRVEMTKLFIKVDLVHNFLTV